MVYKIITLVIIGIWAWIGYELLTAPEYDDYGNIIKKNKNKK